MKKILCLIIVSLFCLSSILPVVNSIYIENVLNDLDNSLGCSHMDSALLMQYEQMFSEDCEFDKILYQEYSRTSNNDIAKMSSNTYSKFMVGNQNSSLPPKTIYGTAIKENGQNADGALVTLRASGYPDETDTTDSMGAWQVDISSDTGIEWPDGTLFNVTIIFEELWQGFKESVVQGHLTNVGEVVLSPTTLIAEAGFEEDCYMYGESVQFYGSAYGGNPPYLWSWDFGDGDTSLLQNPIHRYIEARTYNACLTVTDDSNNMNISCITINVNDTLTADAGGPYTGDICYCIHFFGLHIGGCPPYSYSWDFDNSDGIQIDSTEKNPYHYYDTPGMYIASLSISDGRGYSNSNTTSIVISSGCSDNFPWPMKSQNLHHTGLSPYNSMDNNGFVKWKYESDDRIEAGIVIDDEGVLYFGDFDRYLYALYPNGTLKWRYKTNGWIWSAPALAADGTVYIGTYGDYLYAINDNGTLKWKYVAWDSISSSPAISKEGYIYFGTMGFPDDTGCKIFCLNPNGTKKWEYQTGYKIISDPAIADDGTIYIGSGDYYMYALNPNGTLKWRFKTGDYVKSHPAIAEDGTIYFDSFDGYLYALNPDGSLRWKYKGAGCGCAGVAIDEDGIIYAGGDYLTALYPNGTRKWRYTFGNGLNSHHSSPAISSDGTVYIGVSKGTFEAGYIFAINDDGTLKWSKKISNDDAVSSPCIGQDGTVYIGSSSTDSFANQYGELYAFGIPEQPNPPVISGPLTGKPRETCEYRIVTTDYQNDDVEYYIDWDDETNSGWIGPYPSGENITVNHTWYIRGTYSISVKARDVYGHESSWTSLEITMSKTYFHNPILELLMKIVKCFPFFEKILNQIA